MKWALNDYLAFIGIFVSVWFALVAIYRAETRSLIDKAEEELDKLQEAVSAFWLSSTPHTSDDILTNTHRLGQLANRSDLWVSKSASKIHIFKSQSIRRNIAELADVATRDIETISEMAHKDRRARCTQTYGHCTKLILELEQNFDRFPRKIFWW